MDKTDSSFDDEATRGGVTSPASYDCCEPLVIPIHHARVELAGRRRPNTKLKGGSGRRRLASVVATVTLVLAVIISVLYFREADMPGFSPLSLQGSQWKHCGNSSSEALDHNCILDFISGAWVPRQCYDEQLEAEFLQLRNWHWYADAEGEAEISQDFIRRTGGPNPIFVTLEYHRFHCAYTWKKSHRSKIRHTPIDTHIGKYEHTVHCADALTSADDITIDKPVARFYRHFESCQE